MDKITQWLSAVQLSPLNSSSGNILKEQLDIPNYTGGLSLRQAQQQVRTGSGCPDKIINLPSS